MKKLLWMSRNFTAPKIIGAFYFYIEAREAHVNLTSLPAGEERSLNRDKGRQKVFLIPFYSLRDGNEGFPQVLIVNLFFRVDIRFNGYIISV